MRYRKQKGGGWKIALAAVVVALLLCGLSIALAVRKVAVEEKVERKFAPSKTLAQPAPTFPPLERAEN